MMAAAISEARSGEGGRAEEGHGDRILQGRRSRQCRHGEGHGAEGNRGRHEAAGNASRHEQALRHRNDDEQSNEQADAAEGDDRTGNRHGEGGAGRAKLVGDEASNDLDRAGILHQLAEQSTEEEQREELGEEFCRPLHEGQSPMRQQRLAGRARSDEGSGGRQQQNAPAAIRQPDQDEKTKEDAGKSHMRQT
jgi:hypothetical protein